MKMLGILRSQALRAAERLADSVFRAKRPRRGIRSLLGYAAQLHDEVDMHPYYVALAIL